VYIRTCQNNCREREGSLRSAFRTVIRTGKTRTLCNEEGLASRRARIYSYLKKKERRSQRIKRSLAGKARGGGGGKVEKKRWENKAVRP